MILTTLGLAQLCAKIHLVREEDIVPNVAPKIDVSLCLRFGGRGDKQVHISKWEATR